MASKPAIAFPDDAGEGLNVGLAFAPDRAYIQLVARRWR